MSDKSTNLSSNDNLTKSLKDIREELRFLRKLSLLNYSGSYDKETENRLKDSFKNQTLIEKPANKSLAFQFLTPISILAGAFIIGIFILLSKTAATEKFLEKYFGIKPQLTQNLANTNNQQAPAEDPNTPKIKDVSVDDDPVEGNKDAPVTIVEFSDFDCPWCKTFYDQILPEIKKAYVDTGKVKIVYRDLPIKQLHPLSFDKALAANCARDQGGDVMYFKYHDQLFGRSPQPGQGVALDRTALDKIAADLGLNAGQFKTCLDTQKYKDEVQKDINNAVELEAFGTPSFFIGKSTSNGIINARMIEGAMPFDQMKVVVDSYLN